MLMKKAKPFALAALGLLALNRRRQAASEEGEGKAKGTDVPEPGHRESGVRADEATAVDLPPDSPIPETPNTHQRSEK